VHGFADDTVTFVPGRPTLGDAVKVNRFGAFLTVVVVVGARDVLVTTRVVVVGASVVVGD
jgi:hypothetical protein